MSGMMATCQGKPVFVIWTVQKFSNMQNVQYNFIRVAAATPLLRVADCAYNTSEIIRKMQEAYALKSHLVVFPELGITGYTCQDLFFQKPLLQAAEESLQRIVEASAGMPGMVCAVGLPLDINEELYNCAAIIENGSVLGIAVKTFLPNYAEFYEKRWFKPAAHLKVSSMTLFSEEVPVGNDLVFKIGGNKTNFKFSVEICEDLWTPISPSDFLCMAGAEIIANLSASNETATKRKYRHGMVEHKSAKNFCAYAYCCAGGGESSSDLVFGGHDIIAQNGRVLSENREMSDECLIYSDIDLDSIRTDRRRYDTYGDFRNFYHRPYREIVRECHLQPSELKYPLKRLVFVPRDMEKNHERCEEIMQIQVNGLKKRLKHINCKTVVLGISGGLDSTLALLVCVKAFDETGLDRKGIIGVSMPGFGTTSRTFDNAMKLMQALGVDSKVISIKDACLQHFRDIAQDENVHDITYENTQARERTQILMDLANKYGGIVVGTGDLSELALGWCTYNGDHMSHYAVNCGVPKTLVRSLVAAYCNFHDEGTAAILRDIIDTPISPELLPADEHGNIAQKTEDKVGPYELHDFFLYYLLRYGYEPAKIAAMAEIAFSRKEAGDDRIYDRAEIDKWLKVCCRRFFSQQFKRNCLPDGPKTGKIALSPRGDWRMPSDASSALWQ